jgi:hypothetical protein
MKYDCFGMKENKCSVLTETICEKSNECPFYKTKEQFKKDARAAERQNKGVNQYVK